VERIENQVRRTLAASGGGTALALAEITAVWPTAVGDAVARQAWPQRVARDGTLHVATSSATWAFELDRLSPEIREQLRSALGESAPAKLRFKVGPIPEPPGVAADAAAAAPVDPVSASPEATSEAASLASEIEDPDLRELVARAARASLSRGRSDRDF
jgi:hypothetical protein